MSHSIPIKNGNHEVVGFINIDRIIDKTSGNFYAKINTVKELFLFHIPGSFKVPFGENDIYGYAHIENNTLIIN